MDKVLQLDNKKMIYIFAGASIVLHLCFLISKTSNFSIANSLSQTENKTVRIKLLPFNKSKSTRQIVQTEQTNNEVKLVEKSFLGKKNNTVARQTRSATTGKFKKAGVGSKKGSNIVQKVTKKVQKKRKIKNLRFSDIAMKSSALEAIPKKSKMAAQSIAKGLKSGSVKSKGLGQSNDYLEDIPLGDFTKLNTQEFEFYGFYNRIRERLELFWGTNIQEKADSIMKSGRSIASDRNLITALEIQINDKGEIVKVNVNSTSGVRELDSAAVETFNQAGPFPNPPEKMIKAGTATIKWSFVVNT
jgi:TonB family protein